VILYSARVFFAGAVRALRARTLDMMVLVAVAVAAGWLYSLAVTLTGGGEVFYEAASVLVASRKTRCAGAWAWAGSALSSAATAEAARAGRKRIAKSRRMLLLRW